MKGRVGSYFRQLIDKVWILLAHVFRVPTEHADSAIFQLMHLSTINRISYWRAGRGAVTDLCTFAIIFVLACEPLALEPI